MKAVILSPSALSCSSLLWVNTTLPSNKKIQLVLCDPNLSFRAASRGLTQQFLLEVLLYPSTVGKPALLCSITCVFSATCFPDVQFHQFCCEPQWAGEGHGGNPGPHGLPAAARHQEHGEREHGYVLAAGNTATWGSFGREGWRDSNAGKSLVSHSQSSLNSFSSWALNMLLNSVWCLFSPRKAWESRCIPGRSRAAVLC